MSTQHRLLRLVLGAALVVSASAAARAQEDAEGCKDSPLITRFPGGSIHSCDNKEFDQLELPVGKNKDGDVVMKTVEGEFHSWDYGTRDGVSEIQVFRNMQTALKNAGFVMDYQESPEKISAHKGSTWYLLDNRGSFYYQTIVTEKAMQQEVTADASSLAAEIERSGRVAVYGVHFATGQATILPDSEQTLMQIVQVLRDHSELSLRVEGYTDNVGQAAANQALSDRRAQAVVAWLTGRGIAGARLAARGFGAANPVGDNATEDGRAKNRRVELVKM
ncbi:MAG TPA: OmpA family protein [Vicinamibacterales bacterium]|nr:OmpA family protein [Vicinamibacterales bacterium]